MRSRMQHGHNKGPICFTNSPRYSRRERDIQQGFFRIIGHSIKQELLICRCSARISVLQRQRARELLEYRTYARPKEYRERSYYAFRTICNVLHVL